MRVRVILAVFLLGLVGSSSAPGQAGRPTKANPGPRALGLLELQPNGKAHLIPITILIDGKYYDAGAYKAAPVPMALWGETVYEAVRTGVSQGLFTVTGALQRKGAHNTTEWMGEGTWQTTESLKKVVKKPAYSEPRGLNEDEGPPVLRRSGVEKPKPPAATPPAPTASPNPPPAGATQPPPATTASASPPVQPQPEAPQEDQPPEDKDRPTLKRGKPAPAKAHGAAAASSDKTAAHSQAPSPQPADRPENQIQLIAAISDSHGPDPLPYTFGMKPDEEQQFRKKMLAMATDEVRAHATQPVSVDVGGPGPVRTSSQRSKSAGLKPVQPVFQDVQLRVFDLADINEPELVLTANAQMPPRSRGKPGSDVQEKELQYMVTLVAREDVNGEFHKALANITDAQHMDVTPRLELIDAVDVDGDGRGELLFREVSDAGSAFVVYRVIGDRLYPLFQGVPER